MPIEEMMRIADKEILQTAPFRRAATKYPEPYFRVFFFYKIYRRNEKLGMD
jgi:hypothetical protein